MENQLEQFSYSFGAFLETNQIWILIAAIAILIIAAAFVVRRKSDAKNAWTIRELSAAAMCLALAFLLSFIKLWQMPQAGTVTPASMLPIMLFAYVYGTPKGLIVGLAYGLLQCLQSFWVVHWAQFFLDYIAAFMVLGLVGLFKKHIIPGMILAGVLRFVFHVVSGVVFFAEYASVGQSVLAYSAGYNSFALIDLAICIAITALPPVYQMIGALKSRLAKPLTTDTTAKI